MPIGFMGGIIGKFFHEFGITIVAAVMISMFVSFTLDPMLSSIWHDPAIHAHGERHAPVTLYDRTLGRLTNWFETATDRLGDGYQKILAWSLVHKRKTVLLAVGIFALSVVMVRFVGTEFIPKADFSETYVNFQTPIGSSLEATEAKARQVEAIVREMPEVRYTVATLNTGIALGKHSATVYIRLVDRKERQRSVDEMSAVLRERLSRVAGVLVTHVGLLDPVGGNKQIEFSLQGPDQRELERLTLRAMDKLREIPGLVDLDSSVRANKPTIAVRVRKESASDLGLGTAQLGGPLRILVAGQTVGNWRAPPIWETPRPRSEALSRRTCTSSVGLNGSPAMPARSRFTCRLAPTKNGIGRKFMSTTGSIWASRARAPVVAVALIWSAAMASS